jgi:organic hydroperoxide reductase OsmC/OhrA
MIRMTRIAPASFETETVWNVGLAGTGFAVGDLQLPVGRDSDWVPEHLLLLAAESCFMSALLSLAIAERVDVLGYVSSGRLETLSGRSGQSIVVAPCAVVGSRREATRLAELGRQARRESVIARLLGNRLDVELDIQVIPMGVPM